jgi:hypothetical protein
MPTLTSTTERRLDSSRKALIECIELPDDECCDVSTAEGLRTALLDAIQHEDARRLRVRCGVSRNEHNVLRFMCKLDISDDSAEAGVAAYAWSWWSPLVATPAGLAGQVRRALRDRRERINDSLPVETARMAPRNHRTSSRNIAKTALGVGMEGAQGDSPNAILRPQDAWNR